LLCRLPCCCMDFLLPALHESVTRHGPGLVHSVLDALHRAHVVHVECAAHGMFIKAHFPKRSKCKSVSASSTTSPCSSSVQSTMSSPTITREELLQLSPYPQLPVENTFIHFKHIHENKEAPRSSSAPANALTVAQEFDMTSPRCCIPKAASVQEVQELPQDAAPAQPTKIDPMTTATEYCTATALHEKTNSSQLRPPGKAKCACGAPLKFEARLIEESTCDVCSKALVIGDLFFYCEPPCAQSCPHDFGCCCDCVDSNG